MKLNTYLNFNGNCEQALNFYAKVLGGKIVFMMRYSDAPPGNDCAKDMDSKIMHGRVVAGENVLMASDCPPDRYEKQAGFSINIGVETAKEAEQLFALLSEKAQNVCMPMAETFWAERFGMVIDQFGTPWMVNCEKKQP